jgi:mRNA interferase RelE/StbE
VYKLIFDEEAIKYLEKLPQNISKRILKEIQDTKENPHHYFIKLTNRQEYKLRVGDYRIIVDINDSEIVIYIILIGHRSKVYNQF